LSALLFDKAVGVARRAKAFLKRLNGGVARGAAPDAHRRGERTRNRRRARRLTSEHRKRLRSEIKSKKRELSRIRKEPDAGKKRAVRHERKTTKKRLQQEIFELERELRAAKQRRVENEPRTGALPDFVVIGAMKSGTSFFYHLLTQHPLVERAAAKELHFFNNHFNLGVEWYRRCFPPPKWKEGRRTITGEATPGYLRSPLAAERMAEIIPEARLIALLRNPVDRAYSDYQQVVRKGRESRTFEEAIGFEEATIEAKRTRPLGGEGETSVHEEDHAGLDDPLHGYLFKSIYVDQLLRWSELFPEEQMLVIKSEDFFEHPQQTLKTVRGFLDLPEWEPEASELPKKRNEGNYDRRGMNPATRRRLEEYFEPHNKRLYDFLGTDFGW
jgi:hypothetical protein